MTVMMIIMMVVRVSEQCLTCYRCKIKILLMSKRYHCWLNALRSLNMNCSNTVRSTLMQNWSIKSVDQHYINNFMCIKVYFYVILVLKAVRYSPLVLGAFIPKLNVVSQILYVWYIVSSTDERVGKLVQITSVWWTRRASRAQPCCICWSETLHGIKQNSI